MTQAYNAQYYIIFLHLCQKNCQAYIEFFFEPDTSKHCREAHLSGQLYFQEPTSMIPPLALQEALDAKKPGRSNLS